MPFRLWDRLKDWVVLFVLMAAAVALMLTQNEPLTRSLRASALEASSWVEARFAWAGGFLRALDENDLLRQENIRLASEVARSREAELENRRLERLLALRDSSDYDLLAARVVTKDITRQQNYLTIDRGRADSVEVGMAVIDERGIIGRVVLVSERYARVMSFLNTDFRVPAKVEPLNAEGIIRWDGERRDRLYMQHVVKTEPVLKGMLVTTSGFSGVFPAGLPVGFVDSVSVRTGRNELMVYVYPAARLDDVRHVFVVMERPDPERLRLEAESPR